LARGAWLAAAFAVTLAVLVALYVWWVAQESRVTVRLDPPAHAEQTQGSAAVLAAAAVLGETEAPVDALADQDMLLAPTSRRVREAWLNDGAADAIGRFIDQLQPRSGRREQTLIDARFALAEGGPSGRAAARTALLQFNDRLVRGASRLDVSDAGHAAVLGAAADSLAAQSETLARVAARARFGPIAQEAERFFYRARGAALGWRHALLGWVQDAPPASARARRAGAALGLEALADAAAFQPTLLLNAPTSSSFVPNHVSHLAMTIALASRRLQVAGALIPPAERPR
jgi:hypothetical protein